ncbi:glycosyltransferase [Halomarina salina]|uniref:Glycosyltransferase n=1 Tax=Halomarina salina TaxID=1872699 RepID=A0ABD5RT10_9EURY
MIHQDVARLLLSTALVILGYHLLFTGASILAVFADLFKLRAVLRNKTWGPLFHPLDSPFYPGIALVVPVHAYTPDLIENIQSLLDSNYPDSEVIVVNDGATDETLSKLLDVFDLEAIEADIPLEMPCEQIHAVYRSRDRLSLSVIDKAAGGQSDALNAGLWLTSKPLFGAIGVDAIIDGNGCFRWSSRSSSILRRWSQQVQQTVSAMAFPSRMSNSHTIVFHDGC